MHTTPRHRRMALAACTLAAAFAAGAILVPHGSAGRAATKRVAKVVTTNLNCGDSVTHSTTLGNDVLDCAGNGLQITANNVVLNLNGHTVSGTGGSLGISLSGTGDTVENGTVKAFASGVALLNTNGHVTEIQAYQNVDGINAAGTDAIITGNFTESNTGGGIVVGSSAQHSVVETNWSRQNTGTGISALAASETVSGNRVLSNTGDGIYSTRSGTTISGNTANGNGSNGIETGGGDTLSKNVADFNTSLGIDASGFDTDSGGDKAAGNGSLHQCSSVICATS